MKRNLKLFFAGLFMILIGSIGFQPEAEAGRQRDGGVSTFYVGDADGWHEINIQLCNDCVGSVASTTCNCESRIL